MEVESDGGVGGEGRGVGREEHAEVVCLDVVLDSEGSKLGERQQLVLEPRPLYCQVFFVISEVCHIS